MSIDYRENYVNTEQEEIQSAYFVQRASQYSQFVAIFV